MALPSTLLSLLLLTLVSANLLHDERTRLRKSEREEGKKALIRNRDRQQRSVSSQGNYECLDGNPEGYSGKTNVTVSGTTCQAWAASQPHNSRYPELGEHNYCRSPDRDPNGVWCYTTDPDKRWEYCYVKSCNATYNCQEGYPLGVSYSGRMNITASGLTCKPWAASQIPQVGEHNHCRNPIGYTNQGGVWCYTTDPDKEWEYCDVKRCGATYNCQEGIGVNYLGEMNVTASGKPCMVWFFLGHNYCRNINADWPAVWCHTIDPESGDTISELCSVPSCGSTAMEENEGADKCQEGYPTGASYAGKMNVTASGRTCQVWAASQPHEHDFSYVGEHNYCRNPGGVEPYGVWCYTTDPDKQWELCSVPRCDETYKCQEHSTISGESGVLGASYAGYTNVTVSGRTCQAWASSEPHEHDFYDIGEHNHCRNPEGDPEGTNPFSRGEGVWCYTIDPDKEWEYCAVPRCTSLLKVLDFSADTDNKRDNNGHFTFATSDAGPLPESFTICLAFMVKAWTNEFQTSARMFTLMEHRSATSQWGYIILVAASDYTEYQVRLGEVFLSHQTKTVFFPLQWTRVCLSVDSTSSKVTLVVDGQLFGEETYVREEDIYRPENLFLLLGLDFWSSKDILEYPGRITELNVFSPPLSLEGMVGLTTAGGEECGSPGSLVGWEEIEWKLYSAAKMIEVDNEWEGPCRGESTVQVFTSGSSEFHFHDCMHHCQKIAGGRSPPVRTREEWEHLTMAVDQIVQNPFPSNFPQLWISATEGDDYSKLARLHHWSVVVFNMPDSC